MKKMMIMLFVFVGHAATANTVAASDDWFLDADDISAMSPENQVSYLKGIREVVVELTQKIEIYSDNGVRSEARMPAAAPDEATGAPNEQSRDVIVMNALENRYSPNFAHWLDSSNDPSSKTYMRDAEQKFLTNLPPGKPAAAGVIDGAQNALWWLTAEQAALNTIPDSNPQKAALKEEIDQQTKFLKDRSDEILAHTPKDKLASMKAAYAAVDQAKAGKIDSCTEKVFDGKLKQTDGTTVDVSKTADFCLDRSGYRCMYAGFVIKADPCTGPSKMPDGLSIAGLKPEQLQCAKGQVLCNPLLFGLKGCNLTHNMSKKDREVCLSKASGQCVPKSHTATQECNKQTNNDANLKSTVELIGMNQASWKTYNDQVHGLCIDKKYDSVLAKRAEAHQKQVLDDISSTCADAQSKIAELHAKLCGPDCQKMAAANAKKAGKAPASNGPSSPATKGTGQDGNK